MHRSTSTITAPAFAYRDFRAAAKIDFITFSGNALVRAHREDGVHIPIFKGRLEVPKQASSDDCPWLTIHDPQRSDLQFLVDVVPEAEVVGLEVTVDFFLLDGSSCSARLKGLHKHLTVNLFPFGHERFSKAKRKLYVDGENTVRLDTMKTGDGHTTRYWRNPFGLEAIRLYVKTHDNKEPVPQHSVRLELTLMRGGCQRANTHRMCLLPAYLHNIRRNTSKAFRVAQGIKPNIKRTRATSAARLTKAETARQTEWRKVERNFATYGAIWAGEHGYRIDPDKEASKLVGDALKQLREKFLALKLPEKSADLPAKWDFHSGMYQGVTVRAECSI